MAQGKRSASRSTVEQIDNAASANLEILAKLSEFIARNEKQQRKFRTLVLMKLARIDTMVAMIHGAQIAKDAGQRPGWEKRMEQSATEADKFVAEKIDKATLDMLRFIYTDDSKVADPSLEAKLNRGARKRATIAEK